MVFSDIDDGLDLSTIDGDELALSGTGVGTATLDGTAILVSGTTYRYGFTGNFVEGCRNGGGACRQLCRLGDS